VSRYALFDIETKIDRQLVEQVEGCSYERFLAELHEANPKNPHPFVPHVYHLPIAIAIGFPSPDGRLDKIGSLKETTSEKLVEHFWGWLAGFQDMNSRSRPLEREPGVIVSFNGRGFDIPVLELAALRYGIPIPHHFGQKYGNRYRFQDDWHLDVMDYLSGYGASPRPRGGLSTLSAMVGLPPKDTHGGDVEALYTAGDIDKINRYCRNDVRRLHVVFGRLQYLRGMAATLPELPQLEEE
jgi:predicted PolB exonuclease-like 3'-5' exonuclease